MVASKSTNKIFFPLKTYFAKINPINVLVRITAAVTHIVTNILFVNQLTIGARSNALR